MIAASLRVLPFVLAAAGLVQNNSIDGGQQAAPQPVQSAPALSRSQAPETKASPEKSELKKSYAVIVQSSSTNSRPYKVFIFKDGSATAQIGGGGSLLHPQGPREQQFAAGAIDVKELRHLLREVADVSKIPTGGCAKSVSFGTKTQISYAGKTSGDLQCIREGAAGGDDSKLQAGQNLAKFVQTTLAQLKINTSRLSSGP